MFAILQDELQARISLKVFFLFKGLQKSLKTVDLYLPKLADCRTTCLASPTTPRRRNLLVAVAQYTVTYFGSSSTKSSSWFLSSLMLIFLEQIAALCSRNEFYHHVKFFIIRQFTVILSDPFQEKKYQVAYIPSQKSNFAAL